MAPLSHILLLIFVTSQVSECQEISDLCLDCLGRVKAIKGCYNHETVGTLCGPFYIKESFFKDCSDVIGGFQPPAGYETYEKCATNYDCSRGCARAYHNRYAQSCLINKQMKLPNSELVCADFGRIHMAGTGSCGSEKDADYVTDYLSNMTDLCGCKTVFGECQVLTSPTPTVDTQPSNQLTDEQLLIIYIVVPSVCGVILVILLIVCTVSLRNYVRRAKQRRAEARALAIRNIPTDLQKKDEEELSTTGKKSTLLNAYSLIPQPNEREVPSPSYTEKSENELTYITVTSGDDTLPAVWKTNLSASAATSLSQENNYEYDQALPITEDQIATSLHTPPPTTVTTPGYINVSSSGPVHISIQGNPITTASTSVVDTPRQAAPPIPEYANARQNQVAPQSPEAYDPGYINQAYLNSLNEAAAKRQLSKAKTPLPLPRENLMKSVASSQVYSGPPGLYVEDIAVDYIPSNDADHQYVPMNGSSQSPVITN